jgi:hypothetical protein
MDEYELVERFMLRVKRNGQISFYDTEKWVGAKFTHLLTDNKRVVYRSMIKDGCRPIYMEIPFKMILSHTDNFKVIKKN